MTYDETLAARVRATLAEHHPTERRMFGGLAFLHDGRIALAASGQGGLMVRVDPAQADELLERPGVGVVVMRGRAMRGWLRVSAAELADDRVLAEWVSRGVEAATRASPGRRP